MTSPRLRKVLADIRTSRSRTIIAILSIAIGIFAVGTMLTSRVVLNQGIEESFDLANSSSAVLFTEPFGPDVVTAVENLPEIANAEGRTTISVRMQMADGSWRNLILMALPNFEQMQVDKVYSEEGIWPPATGELLIERASRDDAELSIGDQVVIETPDGVQHTLGMGGVAYDPGQVAPMFAEDRLFGYISLETLAAVGQQTGMNELHIVATDNPRDIKQGEAIAGLVRDQVLDPSGIAVHRIAVHDTPRYQSSDLGNAMLLILGVMGGLVLMLGVLLTVNTVNALLAQQVRQIGMMKAIGGRRGQIVMLYAGLVLIYGGLAAIFAIPFAAVASWAFTGYLARSLNVNISGPWLPPGVFALEIALGLVVPLLAALIPVLRGTSVTVREATSSYGLTTQTGTFGNAIARLGMLPRPVLLSLGNTFRRKGRLALTVATLALAGALLVSIASVHSSLDSTLQDVIAYTDFDVQLSLDKPVLAEPAIAAAETVPGVERAEGWFATNASHVRSDGTENSNIWFTAAPEDTSMIQPTLMEGRWLEPGETNALVVNTDFRDSGPDIRVGENITLQVEGTQISWPVVGVVSSQLMGPVVYAPLESFGQAVEMPGQVNRIVLTTTGHSDTAQEEVAALAEIQLRPEGLPIVQVDTQHDLRAGTESVFNLVTLTLAFVGGLLVFVGSLGLMGAMSLNIIERTREFGVMRAIGASNGTIARIVITEGLIVGLLSWVVGGLLSLPLSWALAYVIGNGFVQAPLTYTFSVLGLLIWLAIVVVVSMLASVIPARSAWRRSVRESLAYE